MVSPRIRDLLDYDINGHLNTVNIGARAFERNSNTNKSFYNECRYRMT
jgi:hypothetical protein